MKCISMVKRTGGKVLKVEAEVDGDVVRKIEFSGDFFAHPEELVEELELKLIGVSIKKVEEIIRVFEGKLFLLGISLNDVVEAIKGLKCVENRNGS